MTEKTGEIKISVEEASSPPRLGGDSWWTRECGGWEVLAITLPLVISTSSVSLMAFTDRMFLLWHSPQAMAAAFQGGLCFWALLAFPHAVAAYVNAFVAQYNGSKQYARIGAVVWQGIFWGFALAPLYFLLSPYAGALFSLFGHEPAQAAREALYLQILVYSAAAAISCEALASFFIGREKTAVVMYVNLFCVAFNIILDWCWIFGYAGFPAWGLAGAAWATVVSQWLRWSIFLSLAFYDDFSHQWLLGFAKSMRLELHLWRKLLWFGGASGVHLFVDAAGFTVFMLLIGGLGAREDAATVIAFTMNMLSFIPITGAGIAVTTLVGNQLGANRPDLAHRATMTTLVLMLVYSGFFAFLYVVTPNFLLAGYAAFAHTEEFASIRDLTIILLRFVAVYLFVDTIAIILASALKGAGDTIFVMNLNFVMLPLLPLMCAAGIYGFGLGILWCWIVLEIFVWTISLIYIYRYYGGKWKSMRIVDIPLQKNTLQENER